MRAILPPDIVFIRPHIGPDTLATLCPNLRAKPLFLFLRHCKAMGERARERWRICSLLHPLLPYTPERPIAQQSSAACSFSREREKVRMRAILPTDIVFITSPPRLLPQSPLCFPPAQSPPPGLPSSTKSPPPPPSVPLRVSVETPHTPPPAPVRRS